jgi:hypothetical protein
MELKTLNYYIARAQVREYLEYILANGVDDISEQPDGVNANAPVAVRLGSTINSVKVFHVARHHDNLYWLTQVGMHFSADDTKPILPADTSVIGIFYMSRYGREYVGSPDVLAGEPMKGDIGSVAWLSVEDWETSTLGEATEGVQYRLFVFWKSDLITGPIEDS